MPRPSQPQQHPTWSDPVTQAGWLVAGKPTEQGIESTYQLPDAALFSPGIPGGTDENQAVVPSASLIDSIGKGNEVDDILGDDRPMLLLGHSKDLLVIERAQLCARSMTALTS